DQTFFNGQLVGEMGAFPPAAYASATHRKREYKVPASLVKPGELNTIAIRVYDGGGARGFKSGGQQLASSHGAIRLEGDWQFRIGDDAAWSQPNDILANQQVGKTTFNKVGPLATVADDLKTFTLSKGLSI